MSSSLLATSTRPIASSKSFDPRAVAPGNMASLASPLPSSRSTMSFEQIKNASSVARSNSTVCGGGGGGNQVDNGNLLAGYNFNSPDVSAPASRKKKIFNKKILGIKIKSKESSSHKKESSAVRHSIAASSQSHYLIEDKSHQKSGKHSNSSSKLKADSSGHKSHAHSISLGMSNLK